MLPNDLINRFTTHLKETLQKALSFTVSNGREIVEPGDLIVGLLNEKGSLGGEILKKVGCLPEKAMEFFKSSRSQKQSALALDLSESVKKIIEKCVVIAHLREHRFVGTEHLLAAILETKDLKIAAFFAENNIDTKEIHDQVENILKSESQFPSIDQLEKKEILNELPEPFPGEHELPNLGPELPNKSPITATSALEHFSRNLTQADIVELLDPVIGRENELDRVVEVLIRRVKSNPVLLGEPGVGKTAIVEGLAQRIADGDVPDALHGHKLLSLDLASTVAGTMYRGEFEARLKQIVEEAKKDPKIILFIDEIHNIVGAGSTSGSLDAANILKPALARGEIRCIGATTWNEYKKHIEPDAALERRFQPITIDEPTPLATLEMLKGLQERYAKHHNVTYHPQTLYTAVDLAERFLTDRNFPDKAIDLLDEAAASVIAKRKSTEDLQRLAVLDAAILAKIRESEDHLKNQRLKEAEQSANEAEKLNKERSSAEKNLLNKNKKYKPQITPLDVARVVARMANVPVSTILASERERLDGLEGRLDKIIVGQKQATKETSDILRRARLGLQSDRRPKASLLFVGPSGTGKTELSRVIAGELFNSEDALIKLDMSEFAESHSISKLVGSPAGYVGYRESTKLTDSVRKKPHSVICFDEIEKAHPDVQHMLLQILEDGKLTDATGRSVSFQQTYVILTSNVGSDHLDKKSIGYGDEVKTLDPIIREQIKEKFKPELINRLDRIIIFQPLEDKHLRKILDQELEQVCKKLMDIQKVACEISNSARNWLMSRPIPKDEGARAIRRLVEREITAAISNHLIKNRKSTNITITRQNDKILIT
ncbi:MAG: ATP-dependent Clp protease ATP-binding subunit [Patescibacteria group bacterium]